MNSNMSEKKDTNSISNMNRRHFIGASTAAAAGLLLSSLGLAGCSAKESASSDAKDSGQGGKTDNQAFANPTEMSPELMAAAVATLKGVAKATPTLSFPYLSDENKTVYLKLENLQHTGAFKLRGAYFKMSNMVKRIDEVGVTTCSAGNHAQGVAASAQLFGAKATIFIPKSAPEEKVDKTKSFGATVELVDGNFEDAKAKCEAFARSSGSEYIPPYDDYAIMAGQGTIAHEILDEVPDATALVVPVGGGGLIGGISYAAKQINPKIRIYGVQAENAPSMKVSLEQGKPVEVPVKDTLADGIHVACPGDKPFGVAKNLIDSVVTVSEEQIAHAMDILTMQAKVVAEGAGATPVAALINNLIPTNKGDKVVCVVSGGNVSADKYAEVIARHL